MADRLRGRAGVEQRRRRLAAEPLCRICRSRGRIVAAIVPDHIVPLAKGGTDDDSNIRCLCKACHDEVTATEFGHRQRVAVDAEGWPDPTRQTRPRRSSAAAPSPRPGGGSKV